MNWVQWLRDGISTPLWRRFSLCPSSVIEKISYNTRFSRRILDRHPLPRTSRGWIYFRLLPFMEKISLIMRFSCQFFLSSPPPRNNRVCNYFFILLTFMEKISLMTRFSRQFFFSPPPQRENRVFNFFFFVIRNSLNLDGTYFLNKRILVSIFDFAPPCPPRENRVCNSLPKLNTRH